MRCSVYNCVNNSGGYCHDKDFVSINDQGKCNLMHLRERSYSNTPTYNVKTQMEDKNGRS